MEGERAESRPKVSLFVTIHYFCFLLELYSLVVMVLLVMVTMQTQSTPSSRSYHTDGRTSFLLLVLLAILHAPIDQQQQHVSD